MYKRQAEGSNNSRLAKVVLGNKLSNAKLFPAVAIKVMRSHRPSANLLCLGSKVGQPEDDFFAHCQSTQITSKMPTTFKPILKIFQRYSDYPLGLGLSDLCQSDDDDTATNFPFCLTLKPTVTGASPPLPPPVVTTNHGEAPPPPPSSFIQQILQIPPNSTIYDLYASPTPESVDDASQLQRIGRLVTTSEFIPSPGNDGLFFRHQKKDEDLDLRPQWRSTLQQRIQVPDGTIGTIEALAGWKLFEQQIALGTFVDFEGASKTTAAA